MSGTRRTGPRVLTAAPEVSVERQADIPDGVERVAFVAQWSASAQLSLSTSRLIEELQRAGYWVVVSSSCPDPDRLTLHGSVDVRLDDLTVLRRPNVGYDFGSWAVAMHHSERLLGADKVLVVNDSLVGPFASLEQILAHFEASTADVWGMVQSRQVLPHLQSYFRGFRYGCLAEPAMRRYWRDIRVVPDKLQLIAAYEYGFTEHLLGHGFSIASYVHADDVVWGELNPTIEGWERLLDLGVPFVKREVLRRPELVPDADRIRPVLRERFGIDVDQWW